MKKFWFILIFTLFFSARSHAQDALTFYGVDFSLARIAGANETMEQFIHAFDQINDLFLTQSQKYDLGKALKRPIGTMKLEVAKCCTHQALDTLRFENFITTDHQYDCDDQIEEHVANYRLDATEGQGCVLIANLLDKTHHTASYYILIFDNATKEIAYQVKLDGKTGGFGLRNYWANTVYEVLKKAKRTFLK